MNFLHGIVLLISFLALVSAAGLSWYTTRKNRIIMERLNDMVDAAAAGSFSEAIFNESLLSSVETKMAKYLSASEVSVNNLAEERDKIKTLIADISHQTKTPIANILLYAELLSEQDLPEDSRAYLATLKGQADKLAFLVESLVKISRLESGVLLLQPKQQAVQPLFDQVLEQALPKAEAKGIALTSSTPELFACFDLKWTAEALYNLVDNAIKYTGCEGTIHLEAKTYDLFLRIDVSDNGIGIPEEEHSRVFGRFYRSPFAAETEGVGIGLYLSRQIITGQGGYMRVRSERNAGSTFSIYLPLAS